MSRAFDSNYPLVRLYLEGKSATLSHKSEIFPTASEELSQKFPTASGKLNTKSPTTSDKFTTPADKLISQLSFSHIVEILTVDDPLARFFYETECIKCCWSVKELRRQIATNLYFRAGISKKPELLIQRTEINTTPVLTIKDPFSFEFLDLRPEAFTETILQSVFCSAREKARKW